MSRNRATLLRQLREGVPPDIGKTTIYGVPIATFTTREQRAALHWALWRLARYEQQSPIDPHPSGNTDRRSD